MDPLTIIATATGIAKATGLDEWLGGLIGGDKGKDVAKRVTDVAMAATGSKDPREALQAIKADAAAQAEARKQLQAEKVELIKLAHADTADARSMQKAALAQSDKFSKRFVYFLAGAWSICGAAYLWAITFYPIPPANQRFADTVLGFLLGTIIAQIIQYFFGSSAGSARKTDMLAGGK